MTQTLTLENITSSRRLRELGAAPGDEIKGKKLVRKFSTEDQRVDLGQKLTEENIASSARLQELEAKPGDRIVNKKLIKTDTDSAFQQFMYGFDTAGNFVGYGATLLQAALPLVGRFEVDLDKGFNYYSTEELYGPGFTEADFDTRREMVLRAREREIQEEYGPYFDPEDGVAKAVGEVAGAIADPTTLIPVGQTIKAAAVTSGLLAGGYSTLEDLAKKGEIDPEKAALYTAGGAAVGGTLIAAGRGISKLAEKSQLKKANRIIDEAETLMNRDIDAGVSPSGAFNKLSESKIAPQVQNAIQLTGRKPKIRTAPSVAERSIDDAIKNDSAVSRLKLPSLDRYLGSLSTRIGNISPAVLNTMRKFEFDVHTNTLEGLQKIQPFVKEMRQLPTITKTQISTHLFNGDTNKAVALMPKDMKTAFKPVGNLLNNLYDDLKGSGLDIGKVENYFPRVVKDYEGLRASFGKPVLDELDQIMDKYAKKKGLPGLASLDNEEKIKLTNQWVRGYMKRDGTPASAKQRTIERLTPEQVNKFYQSPEDSLAYYVRNAVNNAERNKFFGRYIKKPKDLYKTQAKSDIENSIGQVVEKVGRTLTGDQKSELKNLIQSRFVGGEQHVGTGFGTLRDLGYLGTIANPVSAVTQLGDLGASGALNGFRNTISSAFDAKDIKLIDVGIADIQQELAEGNARKTAKLLNKAFTVSGFRAIDRLGKETFMNAAINKNRNLVKTSVGEKVFRKKWEKFYGKDIEEIINGLKSGKVTESVKFHAFNELSDVQPITMLEMPQAYLDTPNGRILYMLKSFMLKQLDIVRRNVGQEWKKGNKKQAVKNAALLAGYLSVANVGTQTVKDIMLNRDVKPEQLPNDAMWALLGVYGLSKYTTEKYFSKGDFKGAALNMIAPATTIIDAAFKLGAAPFQENPNLTPTLRAVPLVGPLIYNWFGGGAEKYNERRAKED